MIGLGKLRFTLLSTTLLSLLAVPCLVAATDASSKNSYLDRRQAKRDDIVQREISRRSGHLLRPRHSTTPCATARDDYGQCCAAVGGTTQDDTSHSCCTEKLYDPGCPVLGPGSKCCTDGGVVYQSSTLTTDCCPRGSHVVGNTCVPSSTRRLKRHFESLPSAMLPADDKRVLSFREGSHKAVLSPHLVADWLINDFELSYGGQRYQSLDMKGRNQNALEAFMRKGFGKLAKLAAPHLVGAFIQKHYDSGKEYLGLGDHFEVHLDDIPEVYGALLDHPEWQGSVKIEGSEWDTDTFYGIVSKHPKWNETVHDRRRI